MYIYIYFSDFSSRRWHSWLKTIVTMDKEPFILNGQFHDYWCPGDARSQGISSHGVDLVLSEYSGFSCSTRWTIPRCCLEMLIDVWSCWQFSQVPLPLLCLELNKLVKQKCHDDVINWKHFPRYWPFERGIHRSPVNSPHKGQWRGVWCFLWFAPK